MNTLTGLTPAPANPPPFTININGTADVVASLPQGAAAKVRTLRRRVSDLHLLLPEQSERQQANEAKFMAEQRLKRLQDHPHDGGFGLDNEDRRVADERRNVARLATEARSITERYEMRAAAWQKAGACLWHIENWLADGGRRAGMMLDDFDAPPPKLGKDESLLDVIDRHREHVRELKAELDRTRRAPLPSAYIKRRLHEQIEALAARGAPSVARLVEHDLDIDFASADYSTPVIGGSKEYPVTAIAAWQQPDVLALFAWLHKDALIERLEAMITVDDKKAMTPEARQQQQAEIAVDLLQTERLECFWVWRAMSEGMPVEFRADTNPLAVLALSLRTATPEDASPGSSLDHALSFIGLR